MANSAQARKRARQSVKVNQHNAALRSTMRTAMKKIVKAIESGDKAVAVAAYSENVSVIDRIADKGIIHKNKAARHKSRLSAKIKAMGGEAPKLVKAKKAPTPKATASKGDKLTTVEGIGPKIETLLNEEGISTFADLAAAKIETLTAVLEKAGPRFKMHKPDTWPQQAALARDGKMDELKALQDELNGGKAE